LQRVFQTKRGRCYDDTRRFPSLVRVIRDALLVHDGSGNKSINAAQENGVVQVHH
jgi:hypothetical protein